MQIILIQLISSTFLLGSLTSSFCVSQSNGISAATIFWSQEGRFTMKLKDWSNRKKKVLSKDSNEIWYCMSQNNTESDQVLCTEGLNFSWWRKTFKYRILLGLDMQETNLGFGGCEENFEILFIAYSPSHGFCGNHGSSQQLLTSCHLFIKMRFYQLEAWPFGSHIGKEILDSAIFIIFTSSRCLLWESILSRCFCVFWEISR